MLVAGNIKPYIDFLSAKACGDSDYVDFAD
jgi:hypothetical protein